MCTDKAADATPSLPPHLPQDTYPHRHAKGLGLAGNHVGPLAGRAVPVKGGAIEPLPRQGRKAGVTVGMDASAS